ncbi:MAG: formylglycine-generating enzyme family protein [Saprospiraceae bacterium]|nr:formylglycine-generating enzyme family protein [Saprospiraceae bacterium]
MIAIEGGIFDMGSNDYSSEQPIHKVKLSDYWLGEYPVTQAVWEAVMGSNPSDFKRANRPVENVSWEDIVHNFLPKLNKMTEGVRPAGTEYRLPTEAQWEYGARGGKYWAKHAFDYSGSDKLDEVGWYDNNSHNETKPVGLKTPNLLGVYDMSGNVWEWCSDKREGYSQNYEQVIKDSLKDPITGALVNPKGVREGTNRVRRGGGWFNYAEYCRPTYRFSTTPAYRNNAIGFRLALFFSSV